MQKHFSLLALTVLAATLTAWGLFSLHSEESSQPAATLHGSAATTTLTTTPLLQQRGSTTLLFVGDMFFDRYIRKMSRMHGEDRLFSCIDPLLKSVDAVVGNLEGPITENDSISEGTEIGSPENFQFTFPTTTGALLFRHNIKVVDLGNNHITNFGRSGMLSTQQYLQESGVGYFGGVEGDEPVFETTIGGTPFAFVSYNAFYGAGVDTVERMIVDEKKKGKYVIVFAHWGNEYSTSTTGLESIATLFAKSGAQLIVGAHPHVVLPHEIRAGTPVYYSLGNFIFDQYWNESVTHGLALALTIHGGSTSLTEYPTEILRDGRTCLSQ